MEKRAIKLLALKDIKGYSNKKILDLIRSFGNLETFYMSMLANNKINESILKKYDSVLAHCRDQGIQILTYFDKEYPSSLKNIGSPPLVLFAKGDISLLKLHSISIVGTREATERSLSWTYDSSKKLAQLGYVVVSGGALGTDAAAHKGALDSGGKTVCVLGSGISNPYPKQNEELIETISQKGLVLSERLPYQNVDRFSLLERNRITSGLSDKVLIVSTRINGGSMSQYKVALSQKKEIFCPHPTLGLSPTEGIKRILDENKEVKAIQDVREVVDCVDKEKCQHQQILESFV